MSVIALLGLLTLVAVYGVETVHYTRRNTEHAHDLYILTSVLSEANVALMQCFVKENSNVRLTWNETRHLCCKAIATSSVHVLERRNVLSNCQAQAAPVPTVAKTSPSQTQPRLLLLESHSVNKIPDVTNSVWSYFVWDDVILLGFWLTSHEAGQRTAFLQPLMSDDSRSFFQASINSSLALSGGMHRSMQHSINVILPELATDLKATLNLQVSIWIQLFLPPDVFVLPNDAFEDNAQWNLTMHTASGRVMSEEEAAYASPSHVVLVHVQGHVNANNVSQINFATKMHFRYPQPSKDPLKNFQIVSIMAPEVVAGQIIAVEASNNMTTTLYLQPPGHVKPTSTLDSPVILYVQVATPLASDVTFVLASTIVVSLIGAAVIWNEMRRAASRLR
ncbi:hypothetical protein MPSEU_000847500 [Mayamaea pseudoterrestris]|nr:hypothetical protein MPSEU_000847500 [Mayamaea pseudoterrestris]